MTEKEICELLEKKQYKTVKEAFAEMNEVDLAELLDMTQSAISHQLRVLKQMKLVKNRREGKTVYYSLADGHIQTIISQGMEHIAE